MDERPQEVERLARLIVTAMLNQNRMLEATVGNAEYPYLQHIIGVYDDYDNKVYNALEMAEEILAEWPTSSAAPVDRRIEWT